MQSPSLSRVTGAILIVAGTTIGAGMLALPMTSMQIGFNNSLWLLIGLWALMGFTALVTLEINLRLGIGKSSTGTSIASLAHNTFGPYGRLIASFSLWLLFYALLAAYISGGSSFIKLAADTTFNHSVPFWVMAVVFTFVLGSFINACVRMVDYVNRILFSVKIVIFIVMVVFLSPYVRLENLTYHQGNLSALSIAAPVFFTSFGFHGSIPTLITYVGPHPRQLRWVILGGSFIPLVVYLIWQMITLGVLSPAAFSATSSPINVAMFIQHLNAATQNSWLFAATHIFTFLAITTSFLGVAIGLFDALAEAFNWPTHTQSQRLKVSLLTFLPPLFFALFYPEGFIMALGYAAIALSILAVLMPVAIALKERPYQLTMPLYRVAGGKVALALAFIAGVLIIAFEVMNQV